MKDRIVKNKKIIVLAFVIIFFSLLSMIITYKTEWSSAMMQTWSVCTVKNPNEAGTFRLSDNETVSQDIQPVSDQLTGISIYLSYNEPDPDGYLEIQFWNKTDEELIQEWTYCLSEIETIDGFADFYLDEIYNVDRDDLYNIKIKACGIENYSPELLKASTSSQSLCSNMSDGKTEYDYAFSYRLLNGNSYALKGIFCVFVLLIVGTLIGGTILILKKKDIQIIFVFVALGIGFIYMFMIPPYAAPDEGSHFVTTYAESSIIMGKDAVDENGRVIAEADGATYLIREEIPTKNSYVRYIKGVLGKTDEVQVEEVSLRKPLSMKHPGYFPQVIGVTLARLMSLNGEQVLYMGRLFALVWYCFIMYWAIKLIPQWKSMMFILGLFPMTMQLVVSYNYDSVLLGISFFTFSYLLYLKYEKVKIDIKDVFIILLCTVFIASIKFIYLPILGLALLIPKEKFGNSRKKVIIGGGTAIVAITIIVLTNMSRIGNVVSNGEASLVSDNALTNYSLGACIADPLSTILIFYRTLEFYISEYIDSMFGSPLGWWEISLPSIVLLGFFVIIMITMMKDVKEKKLLVSEKFWIIVLSVGMVLLVMFSLLIEYTYVGSRTILGIQGRYFLPFLPLILIGIQNQRLILKDNNIEYYMPLIIVALHAYITWYVTMTIICR